jgi:hypothetical protein
MVISFKIKLGNKLTDDEKGNSSFIDDDKSAIYRALSLRKDSDNLQFAITGGINDDVTI